MDAAILGKAEEWVTKRKEKEWQALMGGAARIEEAVDRLPDDWSF